MNIEIRISESEEEIFDSGVIPAVIVDEMPVETAEGEGLVKVYSDNSWSFLLRRIEAMYSILVDSPTYIESGYQAGFEGEQSNFDMGRDWRLVFLPHNETSFEYAFISRSTDLPSAEHPLPDPADVEPEYRFPFEEIVIKKGDYITSLYEATERYIELSELAKGEPEMGPRAVNDNFETLYIGLKATFEYYNRHGTVEGFKFDPESDFVQQYLYVSRIQSSNIDNYLIDVGVLENEVERIQSEVDNDEVSEKYETLLNSDSLSLEVRAEVSRILMSSPDRRARDALLQTRWRDQVAVVPNAVQALVQLGGDDVRNGLLELLDFSDKEPIRKAAVEGLAEFDGDEVREALETIRDDPDESEQIRDAASDSLEQF
jgi:hypothetical protein